MVSGEIESKVILSKLNSFCTIKMIYVVEWFELCWDVIFLTWQNGHQGINWVCGPQPTQTVLK